MAVEGQPGRLLWERNGVVDVEVVVDARSPAVGGPGRRVDTPGDHRAMSQDQPPAGPSTDRVSATGRVALSAHEVFLILCDPARHVEIDDSAMVRPAPDATRLTEVGQTFDVEMDRRPLHDTPNTEAYLNLVRDVPDYRVRCTVTRLIPDQLIEWSVQAAGKPPGGHVWGWEIQPLTDGSCQVTNYCDWTNISDDLRARFRWPVVPVDRFERSIQRLGEIATREHGGDIGRP